MSRYSENPNYSVIQAQLTVLTQRVDELQRQMKNMSGAVTRTEILELIQRVQELSQKTTPTCSPSDRTIQLCGNHWSERKPEERGFGFYANFYCQKEAGHEASWAHAADVNGAHIEWRSA